LFYAGLIIGFVGTASLIKPLAFFGIRTRLRGVLVLGIGLIVASVGAFLPARDTQVETIRTQLDGFAPVYQFNEVHRTQIRASRVLSYRAIKEVTADEILFFRPLTWLRRLGRPGPESSKNDVRVATSSSGNRSGALRILAEEPEREVVVGTLVSAPAGVRIKAHPTPEDFKALKAPGFAKGTRNFRLEDLAPATSLVPTQPP